MYAYALVLEYPFLLESSRIWKNSQKLLQTKTINSQKKSYEDCSLMRKYGNREKLPQIYASDILVYYLNLSHTNEVNSFMKVVGLLMEIKKDDFDLPNVFIQINELTSIFKLIIGIYKLFQDELNNKQVLENMASFNDSNIQDDGLENYLLNNLIKQILINFLSDIKQIDVSCFSSFFIEIFSIKSKQKYKLKTFNSCLFLHEFASLYIKNFAKEKRNKKMLTEISKLIINKLDNDQFLKESETLKQILGIISVECDKKTIAEFECALFGVAFELSEEIMSVFLDRFIANEYSKKAVGVMFYKIITRNLKNIDINLNCLKDKDDSNILMELEKKFGEIIIDSDLAFIFCDSLQKMIKYEDFIDYVRENQNEILNLFDIVKSYECKIPNKFIDKTKYKNLAYLISLAYLKLIIYDYCEKVAQNENLYDLHEIFNKILCDDLSNSFRILVLRILYKHIDSKQKLKEFVCKNEYFNWQNKITFSNPKCLLDIFLKNGSCTENEVEETGKLFIDSLKTKFSNINLVDNLKTRFDFNDSKRCFATTLGLINSICFSNSDDEFYNNENKKTITEFFNNQLNLLNIDSFYCKLIKNVGKNFSNNDFLHISPKIDIDRFKLVSIILHSASIASSFNKLTNPIFHLIYDNDGKVNNNFNSLNDYYWPCSKDDEEYQILYALKDIKFLSYSNEDINRGLYTNPGFALFS